MISRLRPAGLGAPARGEPSLDADARERYRAAAQADAPQSLAPAPDSAPLAPPSLTERVRALYEDSVVPVREIAQLAGVSERTLYKYVAKGGWQRRNICIARGTGGRYIPLADADKPHARGLKALDPAGAAQAAAGCERAGDLARDAAAEAMAAALERAAHARAKRAAEQRRRDMDACVRECEMLAASLVDLVRWSADATTPAPQAGRLAAHIGDVLLARMARLPCIDGR